MGHRAMGYLMAMLFALSSPPLLGDDAAPLATAQRLLLTGKHAEAAEHFQKLLGQEPMAAAIGLARCHWGQGELDLALSTLRTAIQNSARLKSAARSKLHSELALRLFERGDAEGAQRSLAAALELHANDLLARWVRLQLLTTSGQLDEAAKAQEWFIDYYAAHQEEMKDPDDFRWLGLAAAENARWKRLADQFSFLANTLYPDALDIEKHYWPAHYETGRLFLEKYNQAEALRSFQAALKINPHAAEVHAAVAELALQNYDLDTAQASLDRALEINPNLVVAHRLLCDLHLANFRLEEATAALEKARQLNPHDEETLGRAAALMIIRQGLPAELAATPLGKLFEEVQARNPRPGLFYLTLADRLNESRRFAAAEQFYRQAMQHMPQLIDPPGQLGLMLMRLGREVEAQKLLDQAFDADPFNVRVSNMLKVLEVLSGYATIETEHFIIRFDRGADDLLAQYVARYLEEHVYPELCQRFGFEPKGKSLFEIFNRAKNTRGHGWFSARMIGLPYIGTVGACAGQVVALASPGDMDQPYNWARVVKHEFVHVLNLQQTNFNTPHWFTEALAVLSEGYPRPQTWNTLLLARSAKGDLFNLDNINLGFIRPQSGDDWNLAYCQAELYAQYMLATYGPDALAKMLTAYADNLSTAEAISRCFGVSQAQFEEGYSRYLKAIVQGIRTGEEIEGEQRFADLQRAAAADPANPDLQAKLAYALLAREEFAQARKAAQKAVELQAKHPLALYVLARVHLVVGETEPAVKLLEQALDSARPHGKVLLLLAALRIRSQDLAGAEKLYELGHKAYPNDSRWPKALAGLYLKTGETEKLSRLLVDLAALDADDLPVRKKLARLALDRKDFLAAENWANQALHVNVLDQETHRMLADALLGQRKWLPAAEELKVAIRLQSTDLEARLALAKALQAANQPDAARHALLELLELKPDHAQARELLEALKP
jgi:tetratricopeptide (TPR) repeat protein